MKKIAIIAMILFFISFLFFFIKNTNDEIDQFSSLSPSEARMFLSDSISSEFKFVDMQQAEAYINGDSIVLNVYQQSFTNRILISFSIANTSYTTYLSYNSDIVDTIFIAKMSKLTLLKDQYILNDTMIGFFENEYSDFSIEGYFKCIVDKNGVIVPVFQDALAKKNGTIDLFRKEELKTWDVYN